VLGEPLTAGRRGRCRDKRHHVSITSRRRAETAGRRTAATAAIWDNRGVRKP